MEYNKCARILVLGKTGSGKSSFINYFAGQDLAKTGIGKPITEKMHKYILNGDDFKIEIYDSKGIEVETVSDDIKSYIGKIKKENSTNDILNGIHGIFYCVSMASGRFEDKEINIIKEIMKETCQNIHIILTMCDSVDSMVIDKMREKIKNNFSEDIKIFNICSISRKIRIGIIKPFGKEELTNEIFGLLWRDISKKLTVQISQSIKKELQMSINTFQLKVEGNLKGKFSLFKINEYESILEKSFEDIEKDLDNLLEERIEKIQTQISDLLEPIANFYNKFYKAILIDKENFFGNIDIIDDLSDLDADELFENTKIQKIMDKLDNTDDSFLNIISMICTGVSTVLNIEEIIIETFNEIFIKLKKALIYSDDMEKNIYTSLLEINGQILSKEEFDNLDFKKDYFTNTFIFNKYPLEASGHFFQKKS